MSSAPHPAGFPPATTPTPTPDVGQCLTALEQKVLWLSTWMIHHANHVRPSRDGLKVGGHQASCASMVTLMTALYFDVLRPIDRVAVKPHGSPVYHAIQYLFGNQSRDQLERFRAFGGAQSYPSRTKDLDDVDISTGSVGMGVAMTSFAALAQTFLRKRQLVADDTPPGRMIAVVGDAELDEGNIFEALLEGWKHQVTNVWWIIDYNRQSLDAIVADRFFQHDTRAGVGQTGILELLGDGAEQRRCRGQIEHAGTFLVFIQRGAKIAPAGIGLHIQTDMMQPGREPLPHLVLEFPGGQL